MVDDSRENEEADVVADPETAEWEDDAMATERVKEEEAVDHEVKRVSSAGHP